VLLVLAKIHLHKNRPYELQITQSI